MALRFQGSLFDEMERLQKLWERDPESAATLVANGKLLVKVVRDGNLRALQCAFEQLEEVKPGQVLIFYAVRMFREACATNRLDILRFMLQNGFDLQQSYLRDTLHRIIESVNSIQGADAVQPLIRFLLDAGVDVNWQRKSDLYSALHVACCKNLYPIAYLLLIYGADVNAIAADDVMPLACISTTRQMAEDEYMQKKLLAQFLLKHQARATWRKQVRQVPAANVGISDEVASPLKPEFGDTATMQSNRSILSFSNSFNIQCIVHESIDDRDRAGIMFDTSAVVE